MAIVFIGWYFKKHKAPQLVGQSFFFADRGAILGFYLTENVKDLAVTRRPSCFQPSKRLFGIFLIFLGDY